MSRPIAGVCASPTPNDRQPPAGQFFQPRPRTTRPDGAPVGTPFFSAAMPLTNTWLTPPARSEEHTSELQSLMRISYAVFCLNKQTTPSTVTNNTSCPTHTNSYN